MKKETTNTRSRVLLGGIALGTTAGAVATLARFVHHEIIRRGYPSWEECRCNFKTQQTIYQVWHSHNKQRGETIVSQEWGIYLIRPPQWLRRFLHHASQVCATLNPRSHYLERVTLSPQESYQFASLLHASTTNEDLPEPSPEERSYVVWRREVLHFPRYLFDASIRRLYPSHISPDRLEYAEGLPALWDHNSNLPLPTEESSLLETPIGTRIDWIGWSPTQISFCTARLREVPHG